MILIIHRWVQCAVRLLLHAFVRFLIKVAVVVASLVTNYLFTLTWSSSAAVQGSGLGP
jgi:uncharacterized cupredoxin-like copper-binding protein